MAQIIDGKRIAKEIKDKLKEEVSVLKERGTKICLAVIQVGQDAASSVYVNNKKKACAYIGIDSVSYELKEATTEAELVELIEKLNHTEKVHGILVQLPLHTYDFTGQGCRRISSGERGTALARRDRICILHTGGDHSAFEVFRN